MAREHSRLPLDTEVPRNLTPCLNTPEEVVGVSSWSSVKLSWSVSESTLGRIGENSHRQVALWQNARILDEAAACVQRAVLLEIEARRSFERLQFNISRFAPGIAPVPKNHIARIRFATVISSLQDDIATRGVNP